MRVLRNPFVVVDDLLVRRNLKLSASSQYLSMSGGVHLYGSYKGTIVYASERGQEEPATYSCFSKSTRSRERAACKCVANVRALPLHHDQQAAVPPGVLWTETKVASQDQSACTLSFHHLSSTSLSQYGYRSKCSIVFECCRVRSIT